MVESLPLSRNSLSVVTPLPSQARCRLTISDCRLPRFPGGRYPVSKGPPRSGTFPSRQGAVLLARVGPTRGQGRNGERLLVTGSPAAAYSHRTPGENRTLFVWLRTRSRNQWTTGACWGRMVPPPLRKLSLFPCPIGFGLIGKTLHPHLAGCQSLSGTAHF